ncbi:ABC transporter [Novosphingobium sp.]|uniref:ABC-type transport auxiliary lipoprotein family protein n=1 Tax=Novosphingobium sp. TaxID=1874826 RepID=UPI0025D5BC29|nr:ABC transporter [Novosphingobium sp.]
MKGMKGMGPAAKIAAAKLLAVPALLLTVAGCVSLGGGKPPPFLLSLSASTQVPAGAAASGTVASAIMVMEPETDQRLAVLRVPVQVDDTQVAYLVGTAWVERPSRLFRGLLAETLRSRTQVLVLEDTQAAPVSGTRLSGRLIDMGFDARNQSVVVRFDAMRTGPKGELQTKRFESVVPGVQPKPEFVGPALNKAANDVAGQVADWVVAGQA